MIYFPKAKINIGLFVTEKRTDGFHNIESVFCTVGLTDVIEFIPSDQLPVFKISGIDVDCEPEHNLCYKAFLLMKERYNLPSLAFRMIKNIPVGAGLGGGSADAAYTIMALNERFDIGLSKAEQKEIAAFLGSDCSFFIEQKPCIVRGKGECLMPINLSLAGKYIVLFNPGIHISTKVAYQGVQIQKPAIPMEGIIQLPFAEWKNHLFNSFETGIFKKYPVISEIKKELYLAGAEFALMTGSGSSVYGIFEKIPEISDAISSYKIWDGIIGEES